MTEKTYIVQNPKTGETQPPLDTTAIMSAWPKEGATLILNAARGEALAAVDEQHAKFMRDLTGGASIEERDTWQAKELAARALVEGIAEPAETEMLTIEAGYLEIEPAQLAATIIGKADLFKKLTGLAAGVRGKARAAIQAATTPAELQAATDTATADVQAALAAFTGG